MEFIRRQNFGINRVFSFLYITCFVDIYQINGYLPLSTNKFRPPKHKQIIICIPNAHNNCRCSSSIKQRKNHWSNNNS